MVWDLIWGTSSLYKSKIKKKFKEKESLPFGPTGSADSL